MLEEQDVRDLLDATDRSLRYLEDNDSDKVSDNLFNSLQQQANLLGFILQLPPKYGINSEAMVYAIGYRDSHEPLQAILQRARARREKETKRPSPERN